jgi:ribosomal protein S18 acetylase RimI-like enzyme
MLRISLAGDDYISMLSAKPAKDRVVPISLIRNVNKTEQSLSSLKRISGGFDSMDGILPLVQQWQNQESELELCFGVFNQRNVGFVFLRGSEIKALVVHPATRRRGVGQRIIDLLTSEIGQLTLPSELKSGLLQHMLVQKSRL